jgi:hypothetical protein
VDQELKRIERHVQLMNIKRAEQATERVQAERKAAQQQQELVRAKQRRQEEARLIEKRAEQLMAQRLKSQRLVVLPAQRTGLSMCVIFAFVSQ